MTNPHTELVSADPINAIQAVSNAEILQQIATAKRYPRSLTKVRAEMVEMATLDEETAASCFYSLPRSGKNIQGPSIRLAEIALSCYGNVRAGTRIIETVIDGPSPYVTIQAVCHDLEKNIAVMMEKRRRIIGKKSKGGIPDEDDINLATNAGSAIAFRDAMFKIVPGILLRPVYEAAKKLAIGDAKTLTDRRQRAIEAFAKMGVPAERVIASLERTKIEEVTLEDLETLLGTFTAIKEGSISIENAFPPTPPKTREPKKVERPDFGETESVPSAGEPEPGASAPVAKRERKAKAAPEEKKAAETPLSRLYSELKDYGRNPEEFVGDLKAIKFQGIAENAELLSELDLSICERILDIGLDKVLSQIRDAKWLSGLQ